MPNKLCKHDGDFQVQHEVLAISLSLTSQAPDHRILRVRIRCGQCGMPMEFTGVPVDTQPHFDGPITPPDKLSLLTPIRPGATRLFTP